MTESTDWSDVTVHPTRNLDLSLDATRLQIPGGSLLNVFFSNRFRPEDLSALLERHGFGRSHFTETATSAKAVWHTEKV